MNLSSLSPAAPAAAPAAPVPVVTLARGDGIGPEIMDAVLRILDRAGARIATEEIEVGEKVYRAGHTAGIGEEAWASLRRRTHGENRGKSRSPKSKTQVGKCHESSDMREAERRNSSLNLSKVRNMIASLILCIVSR